MRVTVTQNPVNADVTISFKNLDQLVHLWTKYRDLVDKAKLEILVFNFNDDIPTD